MLLSVMIVPIWVGTIPIIDKLFYTFSQFLYIYVFSGSTLFCCFGWMASEMLTIVTNRIETAEQQSIKGSGKVNWISLIDTWKHTHYRISQLVDTINYLSGPTLLTVIAFCFILTINTSFNIMKAARKSNVGADIMTNFVGMFIGFSAFALLIYVPHRIRQSVFWTAALYFTFST